MEAGCRLYDMGLWLPDMDGAARAHARRRSFQCTVLRRGVPNSVPPPSSPSRWTSWLRSTASSTSDSRGVQTERPLVLSRTLFRGGVLSAECESLGLLWVAAWASGVTRTTFGPARGFGLVAAAGMASGQVVARGILERDFEEPSYAVTGGGTMYGPAAYTNAAPSRAAANAVFRVEADGSWAVVSRRAISAGEEVLVYYRYTS